jgi:hypothetical protein
MLEQVRALPVLLPLFFFGTLFVTWGGAGEYHWLATHDSVRRRALPVLLPLFSMWLHHCVLFER